MEPIGYIESCYTSRFATPRQSQLVSSAMGRLHLVPAVQPEVSLKGVEEFSHIWVIFLFHKNNSKNFKAKVHPPRLNGDAKGVFATRSPNRPNPIGLSLLTVEKVGPNYIDVSGIDVVTGTPVLDIKPYLAQTESVPLAKNGWLPQDQRLDVSYSNAALEPLLLLEKCFPQIRHTITQTLALDPRTVYSRHNNDPKEPFIFTLHGWDIHFTVAKSQVVVRNICPAAGKKSKTEGLKDLEAT